MNYKAAFFTTLIGIFIFVILYNGNIPMDIKSEIIHDNDTLVVMEINKVDSFLYKLAYIESRHNPLAWNDYGYIGKYQFGKSALKATGYSHINYNEFKLAPTIWPEDQQDTAATRLMKIHEKRLKKEIEKYCGKIINNITITKYGILAHFAGTGGVKKYLYSNGKEIRSDAYGATIEKYFRTFEE